MDHNLSTYAPAKPVLRSGRTRTSRNRILRGPLAPAMEVRIRRRAFLRATRTEFVGTLPPPAATTRNWRDRLSDPTTAVAVVASLVALALFLDPQGPLAWLNFLRATALGAGLAYLCWFSLHEARLDRIRTLA